jgi:hypothetical protein
LFLILERRESESLWGRFCLASVIHHGILPPAKSDRIFLTIPVFPPDFRARGWTKSPFSLLINPSLASAANRRLSHLPPIACSRGIDQEDEEKESRELLPHKNDENATTSRSSSSVDSGGLKDYQQEETYKTSFKTVALCVGTAVAFGIGIGLKEGVGKASEFFAGYILEQSLSVDNLFVFVLVFKYFKVPLMYQNKVLTYGIAGAIVFRFTLILLGTATLQVISMFTSKYLLVIICFIFLPHLLLNSLYFLSEI